MLRKTTISAILTGALMTMGMNMSYADTQQSNTEIAKEFLLSIVNTKDFAAASQYLGPWYTEHDPEGLDGAAGLQTFIQHLQTNLPDYHIEIKRVIADGDLVMFHVHAIPTPGARGQAIVDIFRLENGKVVEHWDVTQEMPENSANSNGMF